MGDRRCLKVCVLTDNAPAAVSGLENEWGLSLHLDTGDETYLFDFGQTDVFCRNARALGLDLAAVDAAFLSHAHYDHADGMAHFFEVNDHAPLYLSEACAENAWSTKGGATAPHYIGIAPGTLERHARRIVRVRADRMSEVRPGVFLLPHGIGDSGADKGAHPSSPGASGMLRRVRGAWERDAFEHELTLVVRVSSGLVVLSSCSHVGLPQIAGEVRRAFPAETIVAFVGGLHLMRADAEAVRGVCAFVREAGIPSLIIGHCTGDDAARIIASELPGRVDLLAPGRRFVFGG